MSQEISSSQSKDPQSSRNISSTFHNHVNFNSSAAESKTQRFKKVPLIYLFPENQATPNLDQMDGSKSQINDSSPQHQSEYNVDRQAKNSRFEIKPVEEKEPLLLKNETVPESKDTYYDTMDSKASNKSALKKTKQVFTYSNESIQLKDLSKKSKKEKEKDTDSLKSIPCLKLNYNDNDQVESVTFVCARSVSTGYVTNSREFKNGKFIKKLVAEFLGTMLLVIYACSIGLPIAEKNGVPSINGCLGGGLTLATLIWCLGNISGGHFNPAVTIAFLLCGKINPFISVFYVGFQMLGALTGAAVLKSVVPEFAMGTLSVTSVHKDLTLAQGFGIEFIITFILVLTVFSCVDSKRADLNGSFPLSIGFAVVVGGLFGGPFTGGSMNPARSFGPALITGNWSHHWIYWLGPITGGAFAGFLYKFILTLNMNKRKPLPKSII